ncbi:MAG: DUF4259 domain-containing protein [Proteobacteria bacterium]|nr:DUF4259 domain-containing protein [Pseudomonadota bacterium]
MGAWGSGLFDDDTALDAVDELVAADAPAPFLRGALEAAVRATYLEYAEAQRCIASAAAIDILVNGTSYGDGLDELYDWAKRHERIDTGPLQPLVAAALGRVLSDGSELNELWAENISEYPTWRANVEALIARIGS